MLHLRGGEWIWGWSLRVCWGRGTPGRFGGAPQVWGNPGPCWGDSGGPQGDTPILGRPPPPPSGSGGPSPSDTTRLRDPGSGIFEGGESPVWYHSPRSVSQGYWGAPSTRFFGGGLPPTPQVYGDIRFMGPRVCSFSPFPSAILGPLPHPPELLFFDTGTAPRNGGAAPLRALSSLPPLEI